MKKIINYFRYIRIINKNKVLLTRQLKLRINWIYDLYTVISVPEDKHESVAEYGVNGYPFLNDEVKKYIQELDRTFLRIGLYELCGLSKVNQIDSVNAYIQISYKLMNIRKTIITALVLILLLSVFLFFIL